MQSPYYIRESTKKTTMSVFKIRLEEHFDDYTKDLQPLGVEQRHEIALLIATNGYKGLGAEVDLGTKINRGY